MTAAPAQQAPLPPRWFIRTFWALHRVLYRVTGGRLGLGPATEQKWGTMRVHTIGRRTGVERVAILAYFEDGPNLFTMAMNGWADPEPAWWLNLQAHRDVTIDLPGRSGRFRAHAAAGDERSRLWARLVRDNSRLDAYAARRSRETAVVVFEPIESSQQT
jgi:deazaflavin-dependent oxidoreductase (nitroreductase family)